MNQNYDLFWKKHVRLFFHAPGLLFVLVIGNDRYELATTLIFAPKLRQIRIFAPKLRDNCAKIAPKGLILTYRQHLLSPLEKAVSAATTAFPQLEE